MHLTDCFIELVAYVVYFRKTVEKKQPPYDQVKADITRLLSQSESCVRKGAFSREDYDQGRFMICAWVDEVILSSPWESRSLWQREQLQLIYYNTTEAGEDVFERLNSLGFHQRDVREVYYLCLALGFMGRYCQKGDEYLLEQLKTSNLKLLMGSSVGIPSLDRVELFPEAYPSGSASLGSGKQSRRLSWASIAFLAGPVLLFILLFFIYGFALHNIGENFFKAAS